MVLPPFYILTTDEQIIEDTRAVHKVRMLARAETTRRDAILSAATQEAQSAGVACATVPAEHEHPYQAIMDIAIMDTVESRGCDFIVMVSHGRVAAILTASETLKVLTHCRIPVIVHQQ
jgi:nucleotide-binding universal stress UspA family protein